MSSRYQYRHFFAILILLTFIALVVFLKQDWRHSATNSLTHQDASEQTEAPVTELLSEEPVIKFLSESEQVMPPVHDPFPSLLHSDPPSIPPWNVPKANLHAQYNLPYAPPLIIGFTRSWPILLQAVTSYLAAGWPPSQIYVIENTGVQQSNEHGLLTLQNPFYCNYTILKGKLGVNVIRSPVLMSFAQLQNYFVYLAQQNNWDWYFWSHMDVLALGYEDGLEGEEKSAAGQENYKSLYERCLHSLQQALDGPYEKKWSLRFFAYDHLALVNRKAYEDVGGWDTWIPYYMSDCDMHTRLDMKGWKGEDAQAGIVTDTSTVLKDLRALYRVPGIEIDFLDPNPPPPPPPPTKEDEKDNIRRQRQDLWGEKTQNNVSNRTDVLVQPDPAYYKRLRDVSDRMFHYKHGERGRNTWHEGQRGGQGEPFYYPARGIQMGFDIMVEAGRTVFGEKWGHRGCDIGDRGLKFEDQWNIEKDW